ncbi:MAG: hypothetical protein ABI137_14965 [Antricoccus sp.]
MTELHLHATIEALGPTAANCARRRPPVLIVGTSVSSTEHIDKEVLVIAVA